MLQVENLVAGYGKVQVLHGLSLHVPQGKLVTLIGSNGAGKTTTLRALSGMIRPESGRVMLGGRLYDPTTMDEVVTGTRKRAPYWWTGTNGSAMGSAYTIGDSVTGGD